MKLDRNQINIFNFYINLVFVLINLVFVIEKVNYLDSIFDFLKDFIYTFVSLYLK